MFDRSMASEQLAHALQATLGASVTHLSPVSGGDINVALKIQLANGSRYFVKYNDHASDGMFAAEAKGLRWLAEAQCVRIPEVIAVSEADLHPAFLVLECIDCAPHASEHDEALGRGLAALHRTGAPYFGLDHDNFIGPLPQSNTPHDRWADFYREQRLMPMITRAEHNNSMPSNMRTHFDRLFERMDDVCGPIHRPARLHGDLWSGNAITDERGMPCLVDPAVYGGHPEMDLAMMRLFGGFSERVFEAYHEENPLAPGAKERIPLYQLYPLLVHLVLFGSGYLSSIRRALSQLA